MKLHLPKMLCAALLAAVCGSAWAATEYNGVTYSGNIYSIKETATGTFHNRTFTNYYKTEGGTWANSSEFKGTDTKYYLGADTEGQGTSDKNQFWRFAFGDGAGKYSTLRLNGAASAVYYEAQFSPFTIGGLIVESGTGSYTIGRTAGDCAITFQAENGQSVNMSIGADTNLSAGANAGKNTFTVANGGTWDIASGKTLTFARFTSTTVPTTNQAAGGFIVNANQVINLQGGGTVDIKATTTTLNSGASFNVAEGTTLKLSGTVNTLTSNGTTHERTREEGNGFGTATYSAAIASGNGTLDTSSVSAWQVNGLTAQYNADSYTVSCDGNSDSYWFYTTDGADIANAAGATKITVDTQDSDNAIAMGGAAHTLTTLTINSGLVTTSHSGGDGFVKNGDVIINGGATLKIIGEHDAFGYNAGECTKSITMTGTSSDAKATLELAQSTGNSATMKTNLIMNGHAAITGAKGLNTYGGNITVSGTDNSIEKIFIRNAATLTVNAGGELTVDAFAAHKDGAGVLTLAGRGTTTVKNASSFGSVNLTGGSLVLESDATMTALTTGNGSANSSVTVKEGATLNISGSLNNSWGIKTLTVDGTLNTTDFIVSTGNMVNTITGKGTINADSLKSANVTNKAAFSGVTLNLGNGGITTDTTKPIEFGDMTVGVREGSEGWSASVNQISLAGTSTGTNFNTGAEQTITISGNMGGTGMLVKSGAGTLALSGNNTYAGGTTINGGIVEVGHANALGTGAVTVNNGAALTAGEGIAMSIGTLTLNGGATIDFGTAATVTTLNIGGLVTLGDTLTSQLGDLTEGSLTLFNGVTSFNVGGSSFVEGTSIDTIFNGVDASKYVINFADSTVSITLAPTSNDIVIDPSSDNQVITGGTFDNIVGETGHSVKLDGAIVINDSISMEQGATAQITNGATVTNGGMVVTGTSNDSALTGSETADYAVSNAQVSVAADATEDVTVTAQLVNATLVNENADAALVVSGEGNTITSIQALEGNITLQNMGETTPVTLTELVIKDGQVVATYTGDVLTEENEGCIIIAQGGTATFEAGAALNSDIKFEAGSTLESNGAITMGSTVELTSGMLLDGTALTTINAATETPEFVALFTGVDKLVIDGVEYTAGQLTVGGIMADSVYSNLTLLEPSNRYWVTYTTDNGGTVGINFVPEPATATLSLLALAALAARRKRK